MKTYRQGTNERRLYVASFADRLDPDDTIQSVAWNVSVGISTTGADFGDDYAEITAYGGSENAVYTFEALATTSEGRKHEKTFAVMVVDR